MNGHVRRRPLAVWAVVISSALLLVAGAILGPFPGASAFVTAIAVPFVGVGALLASHRPRNPIGWLFLVFGFVASIDYAAARYAHEALVVHPSSLPGGNVAASVAAHAWHPSFGFFVFSFLLFPNGRLLSSRWRWVAAATLLVYSGLALSGPFDTDFLRDIPEAKPLFHGAVAEVGSVVFGLLLFVNLALLVVAGISLVLRLRRSRGEERQQLKWFVYTVAFVMFCFPVSIGIFGDGSYGVLLFPLIPISAAVAILKYRLYDIDVVVNRTLVYGALTATLAGAYLAMVLVLELALRSVTSGSSLAVAGSTLAVAAVFRPARARIQALVDRRFYRRKYDAQRTLERFATRLRDEVSLDALSDELRGVVGETMQPAHVSLWLRRTAE